MKIYTECIKKWSKVDTIFAYNWQFIQYDIFLLLMFSKHILKKTFCFKKRFFFEYETKIFQNYLPCQCCNDGKVAALKKMFRGVACSLKGFLFFDDLLRRILKKIPLLIDFESDDAKRRQSLTNFSRWKLWYFHHKI